MKQLAVLALICVSTFAKAQISFDQVYTDNASTSVVVFSSNGEKIAVRDTGSSQIKLYNPDYSLWKMITPPGYSGYKLIGHSYISDNLFNSDNNVEVVVTYYKYDAAIAPYAFYKTVIIDETGSVVYDLGTSTGVQVHYINGGYKLFAHDYVYVVEKTYTLGGTIPCGRCGALGVAKPTPGNETLLTIPNPNAGVFNVDGSGNLFVSDAMGRKVYEQTDYNRGKIDISKYPTGIYQISLNGVQSSFEKR